MEWLVHVVYVSMAPVFLLTLSIFCSFGPHWVDRPHLTSVISPRVEISCCDSIPHVPLIYYYWHHHWSVLYYSEFIFRNGVSDENIGDIVESAHFNPFPPAAMLEFECEYAVKEFYNDLFPFDFTLKAFTIDFLSHSLNINTTIFQVFALIKDSFEVQRGTHDIFGHIN